MVERDSEATGNPDKEPALGQADLGPEDYYFDGPYLVFTAAYHLRRGYCCNSGCRHCPWREAATP